MVKTVFKTLKDHFESTHHLLTFICSCIFWQNVNNIAPDFGLTWAA